MGWISRGQVLILRDCLEIAAHVSRIPTRVPSEIDHSVPVAVLWQRDNAGIVHGAAAQDSGAGVLDSQMLVAGQDQRLCTPSTASDRYGSLFYLCTRRRIKTNIEGPVARVPSGMLEEGILFSIVVVLDPKVPACCLVVAGLDEVCHVSVGGVIGLIATCFDQEGRVPGPR